MEKGPRCIIMRGSLTRRHVSVVYNRLCIAAAFHSYAKGFLLDGLMLEGTRIGAAGGACGVALLRVLLLLLLRHFSWDFLAVLDSA